MAIVVLTVAGHVALAGLQIDLRATSVNGAPLGAGQSPHLIPNANAGDVIAFDIYALVTGTNANFLDDRVVIDEGSFRSTQQSGSSNLLGNLQTDVVRSIYDDDGNLIFLGFDNTGYSVGDRVDLDGDSDIDVGSNDPTDESGYWIIVYDIGAYNGAPAGLPNGRRVGFGVFTVSAAPAGSRTLINFFGRASEFASVYREDGVLLHDDSFDSPPQNGILVTAIPEPASCAAAAAAVAVCRSGRRRRPRRANRK